jgi:hypothetical protein
MKKIITVFFSSLIVLLMFAIPGNPVQAEEIHPCECKTEEITGAEKNIIVSNLLKSNQFKSAKNYILNNGLLWDGVHSVEVIRNITYGGIIIISIPVFMVDGTEMTAGFIDGTFIGVFPSEEHAE